jgi:hypothetical protein
LELDVPNTLVSFAIAKSKGSEVITPELRARASVYLFFAPESGPNIPDFGGVRKLWKDFHSFCRRQKFYPHGPASRAAPAGSIMKMGFGNVVGFASCTAAIDFYSAPAALLSRNARAK